MSMTPVQGRESAPGITPSKEQHMVTVKVVAEQGRYAAVIHNDRINYTRIGEEFEAGQPVDGRFEGEVRAEADAADWRKKLTTAGLEVA
jgi:hypothetical protein